MGNKIGNAPDGLHGTVDGTEKVPLSSGDNVSSWYTLISNIAEYFRTATLTLTNKTLTAPTIADFTNAIHDHQDDDDGGTLAEAALNLSDNTTNNADSDSHGFLLKLSMDTTKYLRSDGSWQVPPAGGSVYDSDILFSDITTNNADSDQHGFLPKLSGDSDDVLNGKGQWEPVSASGGGWTQVVNEDGTSFANFSGSAGTWSSDGTVIKQTNTSASEKRASYSNLIVTSILIYEAEVQLRSSGSTRQGGILIGYDGSGTGGMAVVLDEGANTIGVVTDGVAAQMTLSATVAVNTWYKIRLVYAGGHASIYLDGTLVGSGGYISQQSYNASRIGLWAYQAEVWFRNIKAWNLSVPA